MSFLRWCEKRDLNPYGVNHTPLKRARLPVPPLSHIYAVVFATTYNIILEISKMSIPFLKFLKYFLSFFVFLFFSYSFLILACGDIP